MRRLSHIQSQAERRRRSSAYPEPVVGPRWRCDVALLCTAALVILMVLAVWLFLHFDWSAMFGPSHLIDFIAPTARQAREAGWVNIAEGL
ncbi:hypothetical protein [Paracoccus sp. KR1-242]|uniref:hypothetical protein n=1 Tax=Paracoccus sp. KR1-242 TaxID=3410028 RepID=UPI003BFFF14F